MNLYVIRTETYGFQKDKKKANKLQQECVELSVMKCMADQFVTLQMSRWL